MFLAFAPAAAVALAAASPASVSISGTVYADLDGDGLFSQGDRPLGGVVVGFETARFATTGADGRYQLDVPGDGIVWASAPDGYEPGPVWTSVHGSGPALDLGLRPARATGPLRFVHGSDTHLGNVGSNDVRTALQQATAELTPAPHFLVLTGDLTSNTQARELADFDKAIADLPVPFVPVPGNHDWHDGGPLYRRRFGPPMYSFSAAGVHFIVLNFNAPEQLMVEFVYDDLRLHPDAAAGPVVVFTHAPPDDDVVRQLGELGVDYLFTGHIHSNRVLRRGGVLEYNTEALAMGGFDYTPAGYRVVSMTDAGLVVEHHATVDATVARMTFPRDGDCIPAGPTSILAAIELGAAAAQVDVLIDGGAARPLAPAGGWIYSREVDIPTGRHTLELRARGVTRERVHFCVVAPGRERGAAADWPELGGSPTHTGARATRFDPPLRTGWARAVGGQLLGGSPIVMGERVVVPVVDYAAGDAGGLVAFDLRTGAPLWSTRAGPPVHGTPVSDGQRVMALAADGVLRAYDLATGALAWSDDVGAGLDDWKAWTSTTPALASGVVVALVQQRVVALDARTGTRLWEQRLGSDEMSHSRATPLIAGGLAVVVTGRAREGLVAFDLQSGEERWRTGKEVAMSLAAAPVAAFGHIYVVNVQSSVSSLALATGTLEWTKRLYGGGEYIDWGYGPLGTPALADGRLFVPTPRKQLWTIAAADGRKLWQHDTRPSPLRMLPLYARTVGYLAAPVATRDLLWLPGADGRLSALDSKSGRTLWQADLGAPLVSGLALAGDYLVVASYDGTVRVMTPVGAGAPRGRHVATIVAGVFAALMAIVALRRRG